MLRTLITPDQLGEKLELLQRMFSASDEFYLIMAERVLKQQLTVKEFDWVMDSLFDNHRGALYIADVMELCSTVKRKRLPDDVLERMQQKELPASNEQKGGKS
jgi:hypothetical protein